jgi:2-dehydropantoate 2-reductase
VQIKSPQGDFRVQPKCARSAQEIGVSDLVLIALKTTANDQFASLLPPLLGPATVLLTLQNGLSNEEQLAALAPVEQIMGGLCFVCLNRTEPGVVHHLDHGQIVLGEFKRWPEPRTHDVAGLFRNAGVPCAVTDNLARAHWEKLVWNVPFNGLGVASAAGIDAVMQGKVISQSSFSPCLTTDKLLQDEAWERLVRELMQEIISGARGLGLALPDDLADKQIERTRTMGAYKASTLIDFERGQPLELHSLFFEPLRQGQAAGLQMPRLSALCRVLGQLDPGTRLGPRGPAA